MNLDLGPNRRLGAVSTSARNRLYCFCKALLVGDPVRGFPTLIVSMLFLGGLQLLCIGMLGEYVARIFTEAKRRPIYLIDVYRPAAAPANASAE